MVKGLSTPLPRREFLRMGGALLIGFSLHTPLSAQQRPVVAGPPDAKQIDTWLAIHADNTATVYIGFAELGQGTSTALPQVAAEELDLDMSQIKTVGLDTHVTPNQGGTYSSASISRGGPQLRTAAAEARAALLDLAAKRLGVPVAQLSVAKGVVTGGGKSVTYGELVGGRLFNLAFTGKATPKATSEYKLVGTKHPRRDMPDKVAARYTYVQHVRLPGMLHARIIRPRGQRAYGAGAKLLAVDESTIANIPGARVIRKGDFLGVVAETEWDAVRAARQLKVTWDNTPSLPGNAKLHEQMRAEVTADNVVANDGDAAAAYAQSAHKSEFAIRGPYQMHAPFAPNCALADVKPGSALVICPTQDVDAPRRSLATVLGMPEPQIRVQYYESSGTYGHSCYDDVSQAAALLSREAGRPVRLQFMRWDEHGWDLYGPAHVGEVKVACDAQGTLTSYQYDGWNHNWSQVETSAQLAGTPIAEWPGFGAQGVSRQHCGAAYKFANKKLVYHKNIAAKYLRGAWLRSPLDLSFAFASEQALDDLAYQRGEDPYEFRRRNIADERWLGVLDAAAKAANWQPRKAAANVSRTNLVRGRGIGLGTHLQSWGGAVAEIEVNRSSGKVRILHLYAALDAGQVVNPGNVEAQIMGQMVQTASRMLLEEVKFNEIGVTSLDWISYPILRFEDVPEITPVVVQRIDEKPNGAGEETMAAGAAAIANAFFDATGKRMREYPLTPARVLAALKQG
jgi:nicotinate dehydrogenase subunit B